MVRHGQDVVCRFAPEGRDCWAALRPEGGVGGQARGDAGTLLVCHCLPHRLSRHACGYQRREPRSRMAIILEICTLADCAENMEVDQNKQGHSRCMGRTV